MSLEQALREIAGHEPEPFIAPIMDASVNKVLAIQNNIPHWVTVRGVSAGWYLIDPQGNVVRAAYPDEYLSYLDQLPRFYATVLYRLDEGVWLVTPFNASDADQRGWAQGAPVAMHLVRGAIEALDVVDARALGGSLLFGDTSLRGLTPGGPDYRRALDMIEQRDELLRKKREELERQERMSTTEGQIRHAVEYLGAELVGWKDSGEAIEVTWEWDGRVVHTRVGREYEVQTVGFCTAGTARQHNLMSIVGLLQHGVETQHYAIRRNNDWDEDLGGWVDDEDDW